METGSEKETFDHITTLRKTIEDTRNNLYKPGSCNSDEGFGKTCCNKITHTVVFRQLFGPILNHGSLLIYAPDLVFVKALKNMKSVTGSMSSFLTPFKALRHNKGKALMFLVLMGLAAVLLKGHSMDLKCGIQNAFVGWAQYNQTLPWWQRGLSISLLMVLRLVVSNVLPFTSPAFAFLITISQPEDEQWTATFYLLICAAPAGAVVPILDWIAYWLIGRWRDKKNVSNHFLATAFFSALTDYLPFSFWVRPFFMEPAFEAAEKAGKSPETCAATAVLAGHFMIWAGPATTMYSRKFVPDWWTAIVIQPLGMMEDVAVVLATWAGSSASSRQQAEVSLYGFMLAMNLANYITAYDKKQKRGLVHLIVAVLTASLAGIRLYADIWVPFPKTGPITTATATAVATGHLQCEGVHSNVKAMGQTVAWVTLMAVLFRVVAVTLTCQCKNEYAGGAHARELASDDLSTPILEDQGSA